MTTAIHDQVEQARAGRNPRVICRMQSGWLVIAPKQVVRGYCLLLPDPVVSDLNALAGESRTRFLQDMVRAGDALLAITGAARINYEILGNLEPVLHAHILPRYMNEPESLRSKPIWFYDFDRAPAFDADGDRELMQAIADAVQSV